MRATDLVGTFHTHPGPASDHPNNNGYINEHPSIEDVDYNQELGVPGYFIYGEGTEHEDAGSTLRRLDRSWSPMATPTTSVFPIVSSPAQAVKCMS